MTPERHAGSIYKRVAEDEKSFHERPFDETLVSATEAYEALYRQAGNNLRLGVLLQVCTAELPKFDDLNDPRARELRDWLS